VKEKKLFFTQQIPFLPDIDSLPFPARHLTDHYRKKYRDQMKNKIAFVLTSRGCPFRCTFCACWKLMNGKYISRDPESVVEEMATLPDDVDLVCFADDNTLHSARRAWRLSELIKEQNIQKRFTMYARADTIIKHPKLIESLKEAGLKYLTLGIESVRDDELGKLNKNCSVQINNEAIRILQKIGVANAAHFIINPDFMEEDFSELFKYVCDMNLFQPIFAVLTPLPGTDLYAQSHDRLFIRDYDFYDFIHSVLPTKLSRKEFYRQLAKIYLKTYSFSRYFRSISNDLWSSFRKSRPSQPLHPDRLSFLEMVVSHIVGYPLVFKLKNTYRSEPLA
jgi:radical SAM superfamily enzyme YgiQ (UPF0313 family)